MGIDNPARVQTLTLILNQVFELEKKAAQLAEGQKLNRNLRRIKEAFAELGLSYHDPLGEAYNETRTDCEASISGSSSENLQIQEVIKPIIHHTEEGFSRIIQRGVVIVSGEPRP